MATTKMQYKKFLARMLMKGLKTCHEHYYGVVESSPFSSAMTALKMLPVLMFSEYFIYRLPYKKCLITIVKFCHFLCYISV